LPKLAKKAANAELRTAFEEHLRETQQHVERLEEIFEQLGLPSAGRSASAWRT